MSVVMFESMGACSTAVYLAQGLWTAMSNGISINASRWGNYSLWVVNATAIRTLGSSYAQLICGFSFYSSGLTNDDLYFCMANSTTQVLRLTTVTVGGQKFFRLTNSAGTTLGTGTQPLAGGTWYYVEVRVKVSATVGECELRVNGLAGEIPTVSGLNLGSSNIDNLRWMTNQSQSMYISDLYAVDPTSGSAPYNTFLGDVRSVLPLPTGNSGTDNAWTANTGTKFGAVDDTPANYDGDTTYISDSTPGDRQGFTNAALGVTGTVLMVQSNLVARKDDANPRSIAPTVRQASTTYDGTTTPALSTTYTRYTQLYVQAPDGADWTVARVNAAEFGVKMVS